MPAAAASLVSTSRGDEPGARGLLVARRVAGRSVLAHAHASSPLRYVVPRFAAAPAASVVCLVTLGGGLVDGDAIALDVVVEAGATLVLFTQSTTKVFRGTASQELRADVRGTLVLLPDPVSCFGGARYRQRVDVTLGPDGSCVLLDGFTSGRAAYGERWAMARLALRTTVSRGGRLLLDDGLLLDAADAPIAPRVGAYDAFLTLCAFGARAAAVHEALLAPTPLALDPGRAPRHAPPVPRVLAAPSRVGDDGALVRICATDTVTALADARRRLRNLPDIEAVDTFGSRR